MSDPLTKTSTTGTDHVTTTTTTDIEVTTTNTNLDTNTTDLDMIELFGEEPDPNHVLCFDCDFDLVEQVGTDVFLKEMNEYFVRKDCSRLKAVSVEEGIHIHIEGPITENKKFRDQVSAKGTMRLDCVGKMNYFKPGKSLNMDLYYVQRADELMDETKKLNKKDMTDIKAVYYQIDKLRTKIADIKPELDTQSKVSKDANKALKKIEKNNEKVQKQIEQQKEWLNREKTDYLRRKGMNRQVESLQEEVVIANRRKDQISSNIEDLKRKYKAAQEKLQNLQWQKNTMVVRPLTLTKDEREAMHERFQEVKKKTKIRPVIHKLEKVKTKVEEDIEIQKRIYDRLQKRLQAGARKKLHLREKIKQYKWKIAELDEKSQFNAESIKYGDQSNLDKLKKDKKTLDIFTSKMRSEIQEYEEQHRVALNLGRQHKRNKIKLQEDLQHFEKQLITAEQDDALAKKLEKEMKISEEDRKRKQTECRDTREKMDRLDLKYKRTKTITEETKKKLAKELKEIEKCKKTYAFHKAGIEQDKEQIEKMKGIMGTLRPKIKLMEDKVADLNTKIQEKKDSIKKYKDETQDYKDKIKPMQKEISSFKKHQNREAKMQQQLDQFNTQYDEAVEEQNKLIYEYCLLLLPPEEVKDPWAAQVYRNKNNEDWEQQRKKALQNEAKRLQSEKETLQKKITVFEKCVEDPKNKKNVKAAQKALKSAKKDLESRFQNAIKFWRNLRIKDELETLEEELTKINDELKEKMELYPKLMAAEKDAEKLKKLSEIAQINQNNLKLYKQIQELRF